MAIPRNWTANSATSSRSWSKSRMLWRRRGRRKLNCRQHPPESVASHCPDFDFSVAGSRLDRGKRWERQRVTAWPIAQPAGHCKFGSVTRADERLLLLLEIQPASHVGAYPGQPPDLPVAVEQESLNVAGFECLDRSVRQRR